MAWPDDLSKVSTNLSPEEFTIVKFALDHGLVDWDESGGEFAGYGSYPFIFNGRVYEMDESFELVTSLTKGSFKLGLKGEKDES